MSATESPTGTTTFSTPSDTEIAVSRVFDAPRELVWQAATEARHFARWWGPRAYVNQVLEMDVRPGGKWSCVQRAPSGAEHPFRGEYLEVVAPGRLVLTQQYADFPPMLVSIELAEVEGGTLLTSTSKFDSKAARDGMLAAMRPGADESFERLAELLAALSAGASA